MKPVTRADIADRARRLYERAARSWVVDPSAVVSVDLPLHPPSEREVLQDLGAARAWVQAWRDAEGGKPLALQWEERNWARVGRQSVPTRVLIDGAEAIAVIAGKRREWAAWRSRIATLRAAVLVDAAFSEQVDAALRTHARAIAQLDGTDAEILRNASAWLVHHPVSGLRVRQVPVRGMHSKWLERHRAMVEDIVAAATGSDGLGLVDPDERLRVMILDPRLCPSGLRDVAAPIGELAEIPFDDRLRVVLIVENLETLLALPDTDGAVAVHGSGYIGHRVGALPWVRNRPVLYWGDLDSHGFAILNRVRAAGIDARSVLMDREVLEEHRDLWVREPNPFRGELPRLTGSEQAALTMLRAEGDVRLEQERIGWDLAWTRVSEAITAAGSRSVTSQ